MFATGKENIIFQINPLRQKGGEKHFGFFFHTVKASKWVDDQNPKPLREYSSLRHTRRIWGIFPLHAEILLNS